MLLSLTLVYYDNGSCQYASCVTHSFIVDLLLSRPVLSWCAGSFYDTGYYVVFQKLLIPNLKEACSLVKRSSAGRSSERLLSAH